MEDRDVRSARAELLLLRIMVDRALDGLDAVDEDMMTTAPPVVRESDPSGSRQAPRWQPADPTLDIVTHPARSGLSEAVRALRHLARSTTKHLAHHTENLRQHKVAWLGTNEETS